MEHTNYYIFKTDRITGKTINICGGSHNNEEECNEHFLAYMYGFMDAAFEILGHGKFQMMNGSRKNSFTFSVDGKKDVEYFMLLDKEGTDKIFEICNQEA